MTRAMFLGSRDKVIVAGDAPQTDIQVLYGGQEIGADETFQQVARLQRPGQCTDFELCGVARLARTYGAVAVWDMHASKSCVSLLNLDTQLDEASISTHTAELSVDNFPTSSISYSSEMELLAVANEAGIVSVRELSTGKAVCTIKADPCGVKKVLFTRSGQIVTIGESPKAQIKFWDLRSAGNNQAVMALSFELSDLTQKRPASVSSVCLHPVHEKLASGCSDGTVQLWDLRSSANLSFRPHPHSRGRKRKRTSCLHSCCFAFEILWPLCEQFSSSMPITLPSCLFQ